MAEASTCFIIYVSTFLVLFGAGNTLIYKYQDKQVVQPDGKRFIHPFMQTFMSFFGEMLCLIMFFVLTRRNQASIDAHSQRKKEAREQGLLTEVNKWRIAVPAMCDFTASTL